MKRSQPLKRRTPLRAQSRTKLAQRRKRDRWALLRRDVFARDNGRCVCCGRRLDVVLWECHHRRLRSAGGPDAMHNLVALCSDCHRWAHDRRLESEPLGFIVPSHADPAAMPVTYADGTVRLLAIEGEVAA